MPAQAAGLAHKIPYRLGLHELEGGDGISIEGLQGDRPRLEEGGTYCVWGRVRRPAAGGEADLMLWNSGGESAVEAPREIRVGPGERTFAFRFRIVRLGDPHLSLYPPGGGNSLGGIYFHPAS